MECFEWDWVSSNPGFVTLYLWPQLPYASNKSTYFIVWLWGFCEAGLTWCSPSNGCSNVPLFWPPIMEYPWPLTSANPGGFTFTADQSDQLLPTSGPPLGPKAPTAHVNYWGHQLLLPAFFLPCLLTLFTHTATRLILWKYKWECYFSGTIC